MKYCNNYGNITFMQKRRILETHKFIQMVITELRKYEKQPAEEKWKLQNYEILQKSIKTKNISTQLGKIEKFN